MCVSCGCWINNKTNPELNHPEDSTKMPNVKTTVSPLAAKDMK